MSGVGQRYRTARRRVPASASGTSPRERKHDFWAGFDIAGDFLYQEHAAHDSCLGYPPAREPCLRSAKSAVFYACRSMSRASRKRAQARTGLLNPTNTCLRVLAQHRTLAAWAGVPELVTNGCSDGLRGPIASDAALPSGPSGLSESRNILLNRYVPCAD